MTTAKSDFIQDLTARGFVHQCTHPAELDAAAQKPLVVYAGFDLTARSLHVGNLMIIMMLRRAQKAGHKPLVLLGEATTKVGDPTFKDTTRPMLPPEEIERNKSSIETAFKKFLTFGDGPSDAVLLNNDDWLSKIGYLDFLRDYGRLFSINRMLTFDSVRLRLEREDHLTFLEFNYMILQAYDFLHLQRTYGCSLQVGGSDQWGNILNGVELTRRAEGKEVFGLTCPLITTAGGAKMGKTAQGALWLNEDLVSPYEYWQFWRNVDDADVTRFMHFYTDMTPHDIATYETLSGAELNDAKIRLADEATALCHGHGVLADIHASVAKLFGGEEKLDVQVTGHDAHGNPILQTNLPLIQWPYVKLGETFLAELFKETNLCQSLGEARRLIKGSGARLNDHPISDENYRPTTSDLQEHNLLKLSFGKKKHALVQVI